jgi:hypothetical protein
MKDFLLSDVTSIFYFMEVAEEEIIRYLRRCRPEKREVIWGAFVSLLPAPSMRSQAMWVYRAHCRELFARIECDRDLSDFAQMTWAEILSGLSELSLHVRLKDSVADIMFYVGNEVSKFLEPAEAPELFRLLASSPPTASPLVLAEVEELRAHKVKRARPTPEALPERVRRLLEATPGLTGEGGGG